MSNRPKPTRALIEPTEPPTAPPCLMVVFGAAGDLAKRLLVPSLYNLTRDGLLDRGFKLLGEDGGQSEDAQREMTLDGLNSAHGFLQGRIAGELRLKRTPTLEFSYDDTTDRALRLEALIEEEAAE